MSRRTFAGALTILAAVPLIAAIAGGWATITVETLPDYLIAGQPTNITFSVRQHGMNLLPGRSPTIEARSGDSEYNARAVQTNRPGYYTATVTPPKAGNWTLTIKSGFGASNVTLMPIAAVSSAGRMPVVLSDTERGQRLFVAKGCLTCHTHARVPESGTVSVGPNLTSRGLDRNYLAKFLADPSVKTSWTSEARMPNLNLNDREIAALVAFLNASAK
jgi:cytochrome c2